MKKAAAQVILATIAGTSLLQLGYCAKDTVASARSYHSFYAATHLQKPPSLNLEPTTIPQSVTDLIAGRDSLGITYAKDDTDLSATGWFGSAHLRERGTGRCDEFASDTLVQLSTAKDIQDLFLAGYIINDPVTQESVRDHAIVAYQTLEGGWRSVSNNSEQGIVASTLPGLVSLSAQAMKYDRVDHAFAIPNSPHLQRLLRTSSSVDLGRQFASLADQYAIDIVL